MQSKKKTVNIVINIIIILGIGLLIYPSLSNFIARSSQGRAIVNYDSDLKALEEEKRNEELQKAKIYNKNLEIMNIGDPFRDDVDDIMTDYNSILNIKGVMAYIEIPKINVSLPIKHGVNEDVLRTGAGHLEGTSLPVGGESSHSIITAHTGLPSATLFSDLDELEIGDVFNISVLGDNLLYEVDNIDIILPTEVENLRIYGGEDYVTLLTCTPYGINSHRLLVRGKRIDKENIPLSNDKSFDYVKVIKYITIAVLLILLILPSKKKSSKKGTDTIE